MDLYFNNPRGDSGYQPPPQPTPRRGGEPPPDPEIRMLRERSRAMSDMLARRQQRSQPQTPRELVQVFDGGTGNFPTQPGKVYLSHPVTVDADDVEGAVPTFSADTDQTIPVVVINQPAVAGDRLIAVATAGRWVAEKGGQKAPCRWLCGPYVAFDLPTGSGSNCSAALATVTVASDGTVSGATLISGGSCYTVAHPNAIVEVDGFPKVGSGATLLATVGEVVSLAVVAGGGGYNAASPPAVTIAAPGGSGTTATATAIVGDGGSITGFNITSGGSLYLVANPTVTIAAPPPGGQQATATATAKPGVVTSLKVQNPGSGYVDNTPPASLDLTIACANWSVTFPLLSTTGPLAGLPASGTLGYCYYTGTGTIDIPASNNCPGISGVPLTAWASYSDNYGGWVLAINGPVAFDGTKPMPCDFPNFFYCARAFADSQTGDGPGGAQYLSCTSRPYSWTNHVHSDMIGSLPNSSMIWWLMAGGNCSAPEGGITWVGDPLDFIFTLTEPPPS